VGRQQRKCAAHHFVLGTSQEGPAMASTNKSLAQLSKSLDGGTATKKGSALCLQSGKGRTYPQSALLNLPRPLMVGAFSVHGSDEQIVGADEQVAGLWAKRLRSEKVAPYAVLGSNEATYGLREGGAGFHRNRPAAGKGKSTLSAGIVRRVRNADGVR